MVVKTFLTFFRRIVAPKSTNEDAARREFILNVLLVSIISLFSLGFVVNLIEELLGKTNPLSLLILFLIIAFFSGLYALSRWRYITFSALLFVATLFSFAGFMAYQWGIEVQSALLLFVLIIVMAGILINTRFAFVTTLASAALLFTLFYLRSGGVVHPDLSWRAGTTEVADVVVISIILFIIATVSWLSNREIERSLKRARKSEAELKDERDMLEMRVAERTRELRQVEMEKMAQSYRFIEFGRLASGLFHDLMNPLAALSLNIESIADSQGKANQGKLSSLSDDVDRAKRATAHMQKLMDSMRKHLSREGTREKFSLKQSLEEIVHVLTPYARERTVSLVVNAPKEIETYGDSIAFTQIMTNLLSNAVDSYVSVKREDKREVHITLAQEDASAVITVQDFGSGIAKEVADQIFEPFFTTKQPGKGLGIGLPLTKRVIEKEFEGTITVTSTVGTGSTFTIQFPIREP